MKHSCLGNGGGSPDVPGPQGCCPPPPLPAVTGTGNGMIGGGKESGALGPLEDKTWAKAPPGPENSMSANDGLLESGGG